MPADAGGSPALAGQGAEQGGDPRFLPGRREGAAAAGQAGAAGASEGLVVMAAARREPAGAVLQLRGEIFGEEAAVVRGAGCAEGAGRAQIPEHAGLVAVVCHRAPVAAVTGEAAATSACGGAH